MIKIKNGFSLIELIMTIIILSLSMLVIVPFFTGVTRTAEPLMRQRAVALGQAMMDEILSKKWDESTPLGGGPLLTNSESAAAIVRGLPTTVAATLPANLGLDGEINTNRSAWNDVDDYRYLNFAGGNFENGAFTDQDGQAVPGNWTGFSRWVEVDYIVSDSTLIDTDNPTPSANTTDSKRIVVTVQSRTGERLVLVATTCNI